MNNLYRIVDRLRTYVDRYEKYDIGQHEANFSRKVLQGYIDSLEYDLLSEKDIIEDCCQKISERTVCWDVGASFGAYTAFFSSAGGTVHAFEPHPVVVKMLRENGSLNGNPEIHEVALGDSSGVKYLTDSGATEHRIEDSGEHQVTLRTGQEVIESGIPEPDLLKVDVEGAEELVLRGFGPYLSEISYIYMELHQNNLPLYGSDPDEVVEILSENSFQVTRLQSRREQCFIRAE